MNSSCIGVVGRSVAVCSVSALIIAAGSTNALQPVDGPEQAPQAQPATAPAPTPDGAAQPGAAQAEKLDAVVTAVNGSVRVTAPGGVEQVAQVGMVLPEGTVIQTGFRSLLVADAGGQELRFRRMGRFELSTAAKTRDAEGEATDRVQVDIDYGRFEFDLEEIGAKNDLRVRTPEAVLAATGTAGIADVGADGSQFVGLEDTFVTENAYGVTQNVTPGDSTETTPGGETQTTTGSKEQDSTNITSDTNSLNDSELDAIDRTTGGGEAGSAGGAESQDLSLDNGFTTSSGGVDVNSILNALDFDDEETLRLILAAIALGVEFDTDLLDELGIDLLDPDDDMMMDMDDEDDDDIVLPPVVSLRDPRPAGDFDNVFFTLSDPDNMDAGTGTDFLVEDVKTLFGVIGNDVPPTASEFFDELIDNAGMVVTGASENEGGLGAVEVAPGEFTLVAVHSNIPDPMGAPNVYANAIDVRGRVPGGVPPNLGLGVSLDPDGFVSGVTDLQPFDLLVDEFTSVYAPLTGIAALDSGNPELPYVFAIQPAAETGSMGLEFTQPSALYDLPVDFVPGAAIAIDPDDSIAINFGVGGPSFRALADDPAEGSIILVSEFTPVFARTDPSFDPYNISAVQYNHANHALTDAWDSISEASGAAGLFDSSQTLDAATLIGDSLLIGVTDPTGSLGDGGTVTSTVGVFDLQRDPTDPDFVQLAVTDDTPDMERTIGVASGNTAANGTSLSVSISTGAAAVTAAVAASNFNAEFIAQSMDPMIMSFLAEQLTPTTQTLAYTNEIIERSEFVENWLIQSEIARRLASGELTQSYVEQCRQALTNNMILREEFTNFQNLESGVGLAASAVRFAADATPDCNN
ncbi:MAG: hypothetical protein AAGI30_02980 [Planctomycetota bacterium]